MTAAILVVGGLLLWLNRRWRRSERTFPYLPALLTVAVWGWLAYLWSRHRSWAGRINAWTIVAFISIAISLIGLYLREAQLSAVLAGLALGTLWLGLPWVLAQRMGRD